MVILYTFHDNKNNQYFAHVESNSAKIVQGNYFWDCCRTGAGLESIPDAVFPGTTRPLFLLNIIVR